MKKHFFYVWLLLIFPGKNIYSFQNQDFQDGYIINAQSDTVKGKIEYRNWNANPEFINFQAHNDAQISMLGPGDIMGFSVINELYLSRLVEYDSSSRAMKDLSIHGEFELKESLVFLRVLSYRPDVSLLMLKDRQDRTNFFVETREGTLWLKYKKYSNESISPASVAEKTVFRGQLLSILASCDDLNNKIRNLRYEQKSMLRLFESYYNCTGSEPLIFRDSDKTVFEIGLTGGLSNTQVIFGTSNQNMENFYHLAGQDFPVSRALAYGAFVNIRIPRTRDRWAIYNEVLINSFQLSGESEYSISSVYRLSADVDLAITYATMTNMLRYYYPLGSGKIQLFANVGLANGLVIQHTNQMTETEHIISQEPSSSEKPAIDGFRKYEQSLVGGLGLGVGRFNVELRHQRSSGISEILTLSSKTRRNHILLAYRLW
ncbi:MAG: hypothetical protein JJU28_09880 [Cyclobacteriaceae bacterium]|nr:hypothetical protein [Cyclobacteriaceae bacterium]